MFLDGSVRFDVSTGAEMISGADAIAGHGDVTKIGAGTLVLHGTDSYIGTNLLEAGTLDLTALSAAGLGGITFDGKATLEIANAALHGHVFSNGIEVFGKHDVLDLSGLHFHSHAKATYDVITDKLTVHSGSVTDKLTLLKPAGTHFKAANDGRGGTEVTLDPPHVAAAVASLSTHDVIEPDWAIGGSASHSGDFLFVA
jgi:autotransporter-associated beta strand protein